MYDVDHVRFRMIVDIHDVIEHGYLEDRGPNPKLLNVEAGLQ